MRCFDHIAQLIRTRRINHPRQYSQTELSELLGYKSGQFISNVERAVCNIPLKMLGRVANILDIHPQELKRAALQDLEVTIENYLQGKHSATTLPAEKNSEGKGPSSGPGHGHSGR